MKRTNKETARKKMTRKEFLGKGITAATAFTIIPSYVLGGKGRTAPSDKLNIAAIGVGSQGWSELNNDAFQNENIVALCDVNETNHRTNYPLPGMDRSIQKWRKYVIKF